MFVLQRRALAAATVLACVLFAGCAGQAGSGVPYASPGLAALEPSTIHGTARGLLYVSDAGAEDVEFFNWPKPSTPIATLTGFSEPQGMCNDGTNVYITSTTAQTIVVYPAGATSPSRTISDPDGFPVACSSNPATGDLAVESSSTTSYGAGSILIYNEAKGKPHALHLGKLVDVHSVVYDGWGNLYMIATTTANTTVIAELPAGSKHIKIVCTSLPSEFVSGLGWDGKYLVFSAMSGSSQGVYRLKGCKEIGFTPIDGASDIVGFYISGDRLAGADAGNLDVAIYSYPKGGAPILTVPGFSQPIGVTVIPSK
jgi:hypothetical protein